MNIQDDAVVKYLDGLFYIRRKKKYISLFHGYIQIAHLMAALSGQNIKHSKKGVAVPENRSIAQMTDNVDIGTFRDGEVGI